MTKFSLLILCAGFGKRMLNLTKNKPKPLLKVNNKTLLLNTIDFFRDIGCTDFFINSHYLHEEIQNLFYIKKINYPINLIYEPLILGTGGGVKNIFNYTKEKNICVVNSDIFWQKENKLDVLNFLENFHDVSHCKILISKNCNFYGLKKTNGDFNFKNNTIYNWSDGDEIFFYSGLQIVSKKIFKKKSIFFPINDIWNDLIPEKNLKGSLIHSKIFSGEK